MRLVLLDFESVLVPELWPALGRALRMPQLLLTTRQVSDKKRLNSLRQRALRAGKVSVWQIQKILARIKPFPGAKRFLDTLRKNRIAFLIVSDCFDGLACPLLAQLGHPVMLCHRWQVRRGRVVGLPLRVKGADSKGPVAKFFKKQGVRVFAAGDSLNDLGMLRAAEACAWFRPSPRALLRAPGLPVCRTYAQLLRRIMAF